MSARPWPSSLCEQGTAGCDDRVIPAADAEKHALCPGSGHSVCSDLPSHLIPALCAPGVAKSWRLCALPPGKTLCVGIHLRLQFISMI